MCVSVCVSVIMCVSHVDLGFKFTIQLIVVHILMLLVGPFIRSLRPVARILWLSPSSWCSKRVCVTIHLSLFAQLDASSSPIHLLSVRGETHYYLPYVIVSTEFLYSSMMLSKIPVTWGMNVLSCSICNSNLTVASGSPLLPNKASCCCCFCFWLKWW